MLFQCFTNVADGGPTLNQYSTNFSDCSGNSVNSHDDLDLSGDQLTTLTFFQHPYFSPMMVQLRRRRPSKNTLVPCVVFVPTPANTRRRLTAVSLLGRVTDVLPASNQHRVNCVGQ